MTTVDAEALAVQALAKAMADPAAKVLYGTKSKPGFFSGAAQANKKAAQVCLDRGWLEPTGQFEGKGKTAKETYRITAAGARHALEAGEPLMLLKGGMDALAGGMDALKQLADLKPKIDAALTSLETQRSMMASMLERLKPPDLSKLMQVAAPPATSAGWLASMLTYLGDYQKAHPYGMCPLPELFAQVAAPRGLSIGSFHDGLRQLVREGRLRLHPYTGAAYTLENEQYALVAGQEIKFYAQRVDGA